MLLPSAHSFRRPNQRWSKSFGFLAFLATIIGLISIPLAGIIYVMGMISIIGIPLAVAAIVFPTICLAVVIAYMVWRIALFQVSHGVVFAFAIAVAIMLVVPQIYNQLVIRDVNTLLAGDIQNPVSPLHSSETLVVIKQRSSGICDETCVELLLKGQIAAYAGGGFGRGADEVAIDAEVLVHRVVRSTDCGERRVGITNEKWKKTQPGTAAYALAMAEKRGLCIRSSEMRLSDLGTYRLVTFASDEQIEHRDSALLIDTLIRPWRVAGYKQGDTPASSPTYQHTSVSYSLLQPLLAYSVGRMPSADPQWWRKSVIVQRPKLKTYLNSVLGAQLHWD